MDANQLFNLIGKVAIVTGASKGIGAGIAGVLAAAGAKVVVSSRKQEKVDEVAAELKAKGYDAIGIACHMGDMQSIAQLVEQTVAHYGRVDILVNNAATNPAFGPVEYTDSDAFDKIMAVNVKGPFELAKQVYPYMIKNGGGSILNISSVGGIRPEPQLGIYSVSKAALISLTKVLAREWAAGSVRCNVICPGLIQTKFSEPLWTNDFVLDNVIKHQPIQRIGQVEDLVGLALFLASDASAYCTGAVYTVDGGLTI